MAGVIVRVWRALNGKFYPPLQVYNKLTNTIMCPLPPSPCALCLYYPIQQLLYCIFPPCLTCSPTINSLTLPPHPLSLYIYTVPPSSPPLHSPSPLPMQSCCALSHIHVIMYVPPLPPHLYICISIPTLSLYSPSPLLSFPPSILPPLPPPLDLLPPYSHTCTHPKIHVHTHFSSPFPPPHPPSHTPPSPTLSLMYLSSRDCSYGR